MLWRSGREGSVHAASRTSIYGCVVVKGGKPVEGSSGFEVKPASAGSVGDGGAFAWTGGVVKLARLKAVSIKR